MVTASEEEIAAAAAYEALHVPALFAQWAPRLLDAGEVRAGDGVLDVACGTGVLAREAARRVRPRGSVTGLDPNRPAYRRDRYGRCVEETDVHTH